MPIPLKTALIGEASGGDICPERLIVLDDARQSVTFDNVVERPLLSINRNFSAPIIVQCERRAGELERLAQTDSDPFARYEAMQELMMRALVAGARGEPANPEPVIDAIAATLNSNSLDVAFKAEVILLPSESLIADRLDLVDPGAIHDSANDCAGRSAQRSPTRSSRHIAATELKATICRQAPRAFAGFAPLRSACSPPPTNGAARHLRRRNLIAPTT